MPNYIAICAMYVGRPATGVILIFLGWRSIQQGQEGISESHVAMTHICMLIVSAIDASKGIS